VASAELFAVVSVRWAPRFAVAAVLRAEVRVLVAWAFAVDLDLLRAALFERALLLVVVAIRVLIPFG